MAAATMIPSTLAECDGYNEAFLLELRCHITNRPNATTAWGATSSRVPIQVTFHATQPPLPSYLCVHCPGLDFHRSAPRVVATDADLVLLRIPINPNAPDDVKSWDFFLYRPRAHKLNLLPNPHPRSFHDSATALLSRDSGAWYAVAAISNWSPVYESETESSSDAPIIRWEFQLHLYRSYSCDSEAWITMPMSVDELVRDKLVPLPDSPVCKKRYHETAKTITLGGERGTVAWVDLWRGILLCDVLVERPVIVQDIPLPVPARENWGRLLWQLDPNYIRDVAMSRHKDTIKYIEMEIWTPRMLHKDPDSYLDWVRCKPSVSQVTPGGWKAKTWSLAIPPVGAGSLADWQPDLEIGVEHCNIDDDDLLSDSDSGSDATLRLEKLRMAMANPSRPTISIYDSHIVYFISSIKPEGMEKLEMLIAVNVRNKILLGVAQRAAQKNINPMPAFLTSEICTYLSKSAGTSVQLKRTEKEAVKPTHKKEGKPTRVQVDERTGKTRPPVNPGVMNTLEHSLRRLGEQMKDAETGDQGAC
ncbi:hypothetical protein VPH35_055006 [Triticum aestivum]|uniref:uncharacterized protein n=1 Tax=Triticum aestivum TaxID=4565 RepID=UPI000842EB1F|nr:uncharacterized protein LOC123066281 [Triticum aestivum]XP_044345330.1 uncharacterized protein LOC123066283 [Triticum aestivum]XP_044446604.1 uncharacterized protein LOC123176486 [Triticum aestivum]